MTADHPSNRFEAFVRGLDSVLDLDAGLAAVASDRSDVLPVLGPGAAVRTADLHRLADGLGDVLDVEAGLAAITERRPEAPAATTPILIVDDHELVGSSLAMSLRSAGEDARFHPTRRARDVLELANRTEPGLVVLDLDLGRDPEGNRIDGVRLVEPLVAARWRVVVLSGSSDPARLGAALAAGGFVWVPKSAPFPILLTAIREARAGRSVMSAERREQLIEACRRREDDRRDLVAKLDRLTSREREVLDLLARGTRAQGIAERFVVSLATVRTQIRAILTKLEVGSQLEAVAIYKRGRSR